jgi:hypothetical protein
MQEICTSGFFFIQFRFFGNCTELCTGKVEYIDIISKTTQAIGLLHHVKTQIHIRAIFEEGKLHANSTSDKMKGFMESRFLVSAETEKFRIAGKFRLFYACIRHHIPFCTYVFIQRACATLLPLQTQQAFHVFGPSGWEIQRQMLKLITNNIRGHVDFRLIRVCYQGLEADDGSDCSQHSHLAVFQQFVWPPPSLAPPSLLPGPATSYPGPLRVRTAVEMECVQCGEKKKDYISCKQEHATCLGCVKVQVLSLFFLFDTF